MPLAAINPGETIYIAFVVLNTGDAGNILLEAPDGRKVTLSLQGVLTGGIKPLGAGATAQVPLTPLSAQPTPVISDTEGDIKMIETPA